MRLTEGQDRILEQLRARWERLERGRSRLVVVMGGPGAGKTAIVHSFYRGLVAEAAAVDPPSPLFWPEALGGERLTRQQARKLARPAAPADGTGHLRFAWMGQRCRRGAISPAELTPWVSDGMVQALPAGGPPADHDLDEETMLQLLAFVSAGGGEPRPAGSAGSGGPGGAAGERAPWAAFGDGVAELAATVLAEDAQWRLNAETVGRVPWAPVPARHRTLTDRLGRLAELGVPAVMFLEDAHMADDSSVACCRIAMASPSTRVLIVATADTGPLVAQMNGRKGFGGLLVDAPGGRCRPEALALRAPRAAELVRIVAEVAPATSHEVRCQVIEGGGESLAATVCLAEQAAVGAGPPDGPVLEPPLAALSRQWQELPLVLQRYLAASAALQGAVWYADQPFDRLADLPRGKQGQAEKLALDGGILVVVDPWRLGFAEDDWHRFARDRVEELLPPAQLDACRRDLFDSIACDIHDPTLWSGLPVAVQTTVLRTHVDLYRQPVPEQVVALGDDLLDSLDRLAGLQAAGDDPGEACRTAARAAALVGLMSRGGGLVEQARAGRVLARHAYLRLVGHDVADMTAAAQEFAAGVSAGHDSTADLVAAGWNVACRHAAAGDLARAAGLGREVLAVAGDVVPVDTLLSWQGQQADWTGRAGDADQAVDILGSMLAVLDSRAGPDARATLATRHTLGTWLGEAGRPGQAAEQYRELAAAAARVLGPDHPDALATRHHFARSLGEAGRAAEAVDQYQALVPDLVRVLGPDHPDTLATREHLARWVGEAGQAGRAVEHYQALLPDVARVLGPDHRDTLATRHHLARWLGESGHADLAADNYRALLTDVERVLGPDHPDTAATGNHLARWRTGARPVSGTPENDGH